MIATRATVDAEWFLALTLTERARLGEHPEENDSAQGARRLARWRAQRPFAEDDAFARRLAGDGLDSGTFEALLGESAEVLRRRVPDAPPWVLPLVDALQRAVTGDTLAEAREIGRDLPGGALLALVLPLVDAARLRFHHRVAEFACQHAEPPFVPDAFAHAWFRALPALLLPSILRTAVLELHVARVAGLLSGATPEQRYDSFVAQLADAENAREILRDYPVLARQVVEQVERWASFGLEFLGHLAADAEAIGAALADGDELGALVRVEPLGDRHRGGHSVLLVSFSSGLRVVYKPRSLALDRHFQDLLGWCNARGLACPFRTVAILDRGDHGWMEFVVQVPCRSRAEARRFYERQGAYLALLYALEATDIHFENLIAAGEHPIFIDLEALFHPRLEETANAWEDDPARQALRHSVARVGLLPQGLSRDGSAERMDLSGMGAVGTRESPEKVPYWDRVGTDEMQLRRGHVTLPAGRNVPALAGAAEGPWAQSDAVLAGFSRLYRLLLRHRDELLADNGPLSWFVDDEVRVLARPTQLYARLLEESFHPDALRDALDRDRLFDHLWLAAQYQPLLERLIPFERADLLRGDIPIFTTWPGSRHIWTSGGTRLDDLIRQTGIDAARQRIGRFGATDLKRQRWLIGVALGVHASLGPSSSRSASRGTTHGTGDELIQVAVSIGDRLAALAVEAEGGASWVGPAQTGADVWSLAPLGLDLYDGLPGVVLFLAELERCSGEVRFGALARRAATTLVRQIEVLGPHWTGIGGFSGWGGTVYALTRLGVLWARPDLLSRAESIVAERIAHQIAQDDRFDVVAGAAGCLAALLALHRVSPSPVTLTTAVACGEHLAAHAVEAGAGVGWADPAVGEPLGGFAHGASGIAWALLELSAATGDERFLRCASRALAYERGLFLPQEGNWRDLRQPDGAAESSMVAWCHGAPGIALARLRALELGGDGALLSEVETAVETTLRRGLGRGHCLCHGDLGNLDVALQAAHALGRADWLASIDAATFDILKEVAPRRWHTGVPRGVESLGLMTGLAGIGYGLLRLAAPDEMPSVLTLAPPLWERSGT